MLLLTLSLLLLSSFRAISAFGPVCAPASLLPLLLSDCLKLRSNVVDLPYAYRNMTWSEDQPRRLGQLPKRWKYDTCQIKLALLWPGSGATARMRVIDMMKFIDMIMDDCVVDGPQRGGGVAFGTSPVTGNVIVISVMGITGGIAVDEMGVNGMTWINDLREFYVKDVDAVS